MFTFESPSKNAFNSNLSYGGIAEAYINDNFHLTTTANTANARLRALEETSPLITSLDLRTQNNEFFTSCANSHGQSLFRNNDQNS